MTSLETAFADFQTLNDPVLDRMREAAARFCIGMYEDRPPYWLSLIGRSGTGKTMLAQRILRFFRAVLDGTRRHDKGAAVVAYKGCKLVSWGTCMGWMLEGDFGFVRDLQDHWLLVIDDIGAEHGKNRELSASKLYELLCARQGKWTVITANLSTEQIGALLDARIASRLLRDGSRVIEADTTDYNMRPRVHKPVNGSVPKHDERAPEAVGADIARKLADFRKNL